jgi:predicted dehydrogenase/threonine dehydrogenase-like Zn-dependent dehydrogenase
VKQLIQSASGGEARVVDVPVPALLPGTALVRNVASVISMGTERSALEFARKSLVGKAAARPDLVRQLIRKVQTEGPLRAYELARSRLDAPMVPGYSSAGRILEAAADVTDLAPGRLVACAGGGYASHAEVVRVPRNLLAAVPDGVAAEDAAFATLGAIALHGFRLADPTLGETVAVSGLGLIGLLAVQIAAAAGCRVIGIDPDSGRVDLARRMGAMLAVAPEDAEESARAATGGVGVDAVLIAAATSSSDPVRTAAEICRDRGRVVVVGAVGLELDRRPFFEKEISLRVSRSYGPGRYDPAYEEGGEEYPIGYVRWTENRNLQAFLELLRAGRVDVSRLVSHRFPIGDAVAAYERVAKGGGDTLAVLLDYPDADTGGDDEGPLRVAVAPVVGSRPVGAGGVGVGFLGAGNFATATLLPALRRLDGIRLEGVVTSTGVSARAAAERFGFRFAATDEAAVLEDERVDLVAIATRHDRHAGQIVRALEAGKHVFCEKPPALNAEELRAIARAHAAAGDRVLFVGYNRRYAPLAVELKAHFDAGAEDAPVVAHYRVNAGALPAGHWLHDPAVGGGRIIGEACHFVDFLADLAGSEPLTAHAAATGRRTDPTADDVTLTFTFADGSVGALTYVASGDGRLGKERVEAFGRGRAAVLDDFRVLELYADGSRKVRRSPFRQDKGHAAEWETLLRVLRGAEDAPPLRRYVTVSLATFAAVASLEEGAPVAVRVEDALETGLADV